MIADHLHVRIRELADEHDAIVGLQPLQRGDRDRRRVGVVDGHAEPRFGQQRLERVRQNSLFLFLLLALLSFHRLFARHGLTAAVPDEDRSAGVAIGLAFSNDLTENLPPGLMGGEDRFDRMLKFAHEGPVVDTLEGRHGRSDCATVPRHPGDRCRSSPMS